MAEWEPKPLGEVCTIKPPKAEARAKLADGDEVSFAPMEDLGINVKYLQPHRTRHLGEVSGSYTYFADGDVLMAKITPCFENGKLGVARGLTNGVGFGSSEYIVLRPAPTLEAEFLYYYLARPTFLEEGARTMTGAVGHKRVTKEFVENYPIPLPPVTEQRRIVAILDEAFEGIATAKANAERNLQSAKELYECQLEALFASGDLKWTEHPLEQVATITNGYAFKSTDFRADPGIRSIKITNVGVREFVDDAGNYLPAAFAERHSGFTVSKGSIVLALTRTIISGGLKVAVVPHDFDGALLNQRVAAIQPHAAELEAPFLFAYLSSRRVMNYVKSRVNTLMQPNLSIGDLKRLPIPVPALSRQRELVQTLNGLEDETGRLEAVYVQKIDALDDLKRSLLHQAFTGAL
jgi:type I restriction enzyme S subunit